MVALPFRRFPSLSGDPNNPSRLLLELEELLLRLPLFLLSRSSMVPAAVCRASGPPPPPVLVVTEAVLASISTAARFILEAPLWAAGGFPELQSFSGFFLLGVGLWESCCENNEPSSL